MNGTALSREQSKQGDQVVLWDQTTSTSPLESHRFCTCCHRTVCRCLHERQELIDDQAWTEDRWEEEFDVSLLRAQKKVSKRRMRKARIDEVQHGMYQGNDQDIDGFDQGWKAQTKARKQWARRRHDKVSAGDGLPRTFKTLAETQPKEVVKALRGMSVHGAFILDGDRLFLWEMPMAERSHPGEPYYGSRLWHFEHSREERQEREAGRRFDSWLDDPSMWDEPDWFFWDEYMWEQEVALPYKQWCESWIREEDEDWLQWIEEVLGLHEKTRYAPVQAEVQVVNLRAARRRRNREQKLLSRERQHRFMQHEEEYEQLVRGRGNFIRDSRKDYSWKGTSRARAQWGWHKPAHRTSSPPWTPEEYEHFLKMIDDEREQMQRAMERDLFGNVA